LSKQPGVDALMNLLLPVVLKNF